MFKISKIDISVYAGIHKEVDSDENDISAKKKITFQSSWIS